MFIAGVATSGVFGLSSAYTILRDTPIGVELGTTGSADHWACSNQGDLEQISTTQIQTDGREITVKDGLALVSGIGISVLNISNAKEVTELSHLPKDVAGGYGHVWIEEYAYLASMRHGLLVCNLENPSNPSIVNSDVDLSGTPRKITHKNEYIYISSHDDTNTFSVLDISTRESPEEVGVVTDTNLRGRCQEVALYDDYAFVTNKDNNVVVSIDVSSPTNPTIVDSLAIGEPYGLIVNNEVLYVSLTDNKNGIASINISDPTDMNVISVDTKNPLNSVYGMEYTDQYIYAADKDACHGYHAININNGNKIEVTDSISSSSLFKPYDIGIRGNVGFIVSRNNSTVTAVTTHIS